MSEEGIKIADIKRKVPGRPFVKGQVANPRGRPRKEYCLTTLLQAELKKKARVKGYHDKTWAQILAEALPREAHKALVKRGDIRPYALLIERADGKVTQPLSGEGGQPLIPPTMIFNHVPTGAEDKIKGLIAAGGLPGGSQN
jgi:hypothetical protein